MNSKITRDTLESFLHCKYKGHLKLAGQAGDRSDYEVLLTAMWGEVRVKAINKILTGFEGAEVPRHSPLTVPVLKQGVPFFLDAFLEDEVVALSFDGLKRVSGPSNLGDFHYVPMLFAAPMKVGKEQGLLLEIFGLLLSQVQGKSPAYGILWHGKDCTPTRIKLR